jgi:hypothetical protein
MEGSLGLEVFGENRETVRTPKHRFRQLDPSWFLSGQTTSFAWSPTAKELVRAEERGGIPFAGLL